jgi:hypothetical protein
MILRSIIVIILLISNACADNYYIKLNYGGGIFFNNKKATQLLPNVSILSNSANKSKYYVTLGLGYDLNDLRMDISYVLHNPTKRSAAYKMIDSSYLERGEVAIRTDKFSSLLFSLYKNIIPFKDGQIFLGGKFGITMISEQHRVNLFREGAGTALRYHQSKQKSFINPLLGIVVGLDYILGPNINLELSTGYEYSGYGKSGLMANNKLVINKASYNIFTADIGLRYRF